MLSKGLGKIPPRFGERRRCRLDADDPVLVVVLDAREEEQPIPPDRASHGKADLAAGKEGIRIRRVAPEPRIGRQVVIAKEEEPAAVILVASGTRDDVDRSRIGQAGRQVEVGTRELELLDDLLGEVLGNAAVQRVVDRPAVHRHPGAVRRASENRDIELTAEEPGRRSGGDSRFEHGKLKELATVQRQVLDLEPGDDSTDAILLVTHLRRSVRGLNDLLQELHRQGKVQCGRIPDLNDDSPRDLLKPSGFGSHAVLAGRQHADPIGPRLIGNGGTDHPGRRIRGRDLRPLNHPARLIFDNPGNVAGRSLGIDRTQPTTESHNKAGKRRSSKSHSNPPVAGLEEATGTERRGELN